MLSWLSCEKYTESASKQLDQQLSFGERSRFVFHHFICVNCRRFFGQLKALNGFCSSAINVELIAEPTSDTQSALLSAEEKERLQSAIAATKQTLSQE